MGEIKYIGISILMLCLVSCGGGGSSSQGMLIEGTLIQGEQSSHKVLYKHASNEPLENVTICALGECSTTDSKGQWGFVAPETFNGGDILLSVNGHNIAASTIVSLPPNANEVVMELIHSAGAIKLEHLTIDGVTEHHEDDDSHHE
jgi:hypothetical protein